MHSRSRITWKKKSYNFPRSVRWTLDQPLPVPDLRLDIFSSNTCTLSCHFQSWRTYGRLTKIFCSHNLVLESTVDLVKRYRCANLYCFTTSLSWFEIEKTQESIWSSERRLQKKLIRFSLNAVLFWFVIFFTSLSIRLSSFRQVSSVVTPAPLVCYLSPALGLGYLKVFACPEVFPLFS